MPFSQSRGNLGLESHAWHATYTSDSNVRYDDDLRLRAISSRISLLFLSFCFVWIRIPIKRLFRSQYSEFEVLGWTESRIPLGLFIIFLSDLGFGGTWQSRSIVEQNLIYFVVITMVAGSVGISSEVSFRGPRASRSSARRHGGIPSVLPLGDVFFSISLLT
ncbi:hypothetical protein B0T24DRAFT_136489 [Lasiosphaeria ovina]|uniref:Uncharacterized protein n=1 Tax=Lasiosphaeria ovina TaxID=92902 RepID=A0AAE0KM67_9PEZI|nr:hypothetical protein B0T24DRAFT_136489 [Lasiosphaeria ovina]